ncbi:hypothetical protein [Actinomycetospora corticicola]|uniref:Uncharacterized protein n=1 Tax=Actinomycetospora corticicola TaxID=663602 RepID=A0A7Y9E2L7_9PSEU|nr:hypothetical protein [Actinomycetospora corticicola]NYD39867.1 hypothetical protein [Actinomycetospora corticicola]
MDQLHDHRRVDVAPIGEEFRRALEGDEYATRALHALAYLSDDGRLSEVACRALRALGGPRQDGRRPWEADRVDQPWVCAVVDQLLKHYR